MVLIRLNTLYEADSCFLNLGGELLKIYGLPLSGNKPVLRRKVAWLAMAEKLLVAGEIAREKGVLAGLQGIDQTTETGGASGQDG